MSLRMKQGVSPKNIKPECILGMNLAASVFDDYGLDCIITSISEGRHSERSRHYIGYAFDLRRRHIPNDEILALIHEHLICELGDEYAVILERTHFHVQYNG